MPRRLVTTPFCRMGYAVAQSTIPVRAYKAKLQKIEVIEIAESTHPDKPIMAGIELTFLIETDAALAAVYGWGSIGKEIAATARVPVRLEPPEPPAPAPKKEKRSASHQTDRS